MSEPNRKLATIVFTDIVGFTQMSAENEPLAIQLLETQRTTLRPIVDRHGGEWLKEMGDGLLLAFQTTKEAIDCCIEIQHTVKNVANLDLRIGVHQGEVVVQGGDVIGDDVNIASRSEPFAATGGIVVTDRVNASLMRDPVYQTKLIGKPALKGVLQEIKLYCITSHGLPETNISQVSAKLDGGNSTIEQEQDTFDSRFAQNIEAPKISSLKIPLILGGLVVFLGIIAGMIFIDGQGLNATLSSSGEKESIAVLPFVNMSSDQENEYFSDGITEEILNYLSKIKGLRVISRTSAFTYKERTDISIADIGRELDVTHMLEGSVRKAGNKVRITAQLIRSQDDAHLWSETYDRDLEDIFAVQDEIAQTIVGTLKMDYIGHTNDREPKKTETSIEAYNMYLQGIHFQDRRDEDGMRRALSFFKRTVQLDPGYELAYVGLANTYLLLADYGYASFDENLPLAEYNANKAMDLNPESAEVHAANAFVSLIRKDDPRKTESYYLKAIELNPNYATAHHWYSDFLKIVLKDHQKALLYGKAAQKLDPLSGIIGINLAKIQISLNEKEDAERTLKNIIKVHPGFLQAYISLGTLYMSKGRWNESETMAKKATDIKPEDGFAWKTLAEIMTAQGKMVEGINAYKKFVDLNPTSTMALEHLSIGYYFERSFDKASNTIETIYDQTTFSPLANLVEGWILLLEKDYTSALKVLQSSRNGFLGLSAQHEALSLCAQGIIHAIQNQTEEVASIISELEHFGDSDGAKSMVGIIKLYSGKRPEGYAIFRDDIINDNPYVYLYIDPLLDPFRDETQFIELLNLYNMNKNNSL